MNVVDKNPVNAALIIGGGVAGQRAALDIAEAGYRAILVERSYTLGGVVAQLGFMFPTHDCVLCRGGGDHGHGCTRPAISPALHENTRHPNISVWTSTEVVDVRGAAGDFQVTLRQRPQYVDPSRCINCDKCAEVCPIEIPNDYDAGLGMRKLIDKGLSRAIPDSYNLWEKVDYCATCRKCEPVCPTNAIHLDAEGSEETIRVAAIVLTSGYKLFDPGQFSEYGYGRYPNVLTSLEFERLISKNGPLHGHFVNPADGQKPKRIAWLQCIGSRDEEHPWCSAICCMHATKEAILAKERIGSDVDCRIFLMDQRTFNKANQAYYERSREQYGVDYVRSRISSLRRDPKTGEVWLRYQDEQGQLKEEAYDVAVLSVGVQPPEQSGTVANLLGIDLNEHGFCNTGKYTPVQTSRPGIFAAGAVTAPLEMAETFSAATAAANEVVQLLQTTARPEMPLVDQPVAREAAPRIGFFACGCGGAIEGTINTVDLAAFAGMLPGVVYSSTVDFGCLPEGQDTLRQAIRAHDLNRIVIAGCSERTYLPLFEGVAASEGIPRGLVSMANVREQCAWVHPNPTDANRKARELARMAVARVIGAQPLETEEIEPIPSVLVLGGGVAGMTSALHLANAGMQVTLVEKTDQLGGMVARKRVLAEKLDPQTYLSDLIGRVLDHPSIRVLTNSQLVRQSGRPGSFHSVLRSGENGALQEITLDHGATIVAIGGVPYSGDEYLLGQTPKAITQLELERVLVEEPKQVAGWKEVVMIQCVGRDETTDSPCSRICCTGAIANALKLKEVNPSARIYVLYRDVMTYGPREKYYTEAREKGILFVRYTREEKPHVSADANGGITVRILERTLGEELELHPDVLALSTVVQPAADTADLAARLALPLSPDGYFEEAHTKMRPTEFFQPGIFVAGLAHYPKFIEDSVAQAEAVANQALQILGRGKLRVGGRVAKVIQEKCVGCLTCVRICPYSAPYIERDRVGIGAIQGAAYIDPARCQGCGLCVAECPDKAIQFAAYSDEQLMDPATAILGRWQAELEG